MLDTSKIKRTFRTILLDSGIIADEDTLSCDGREFKPPDSGAWFKETLIPIAERLPATNQIQYDGIIQYDVYVPAGTGSETLEGLALDIANLFKPAHSVHGELDAEVDRCERSAIHKVQDLWNVQSVSIRFRTYATNT